MPTIFVTSVLVNIPSFCVDSPTPMFTMTCRDYAPGLTKQLALLYNGTTVLSFYAGVSKSGGQMISFTMTTEQAQMLISLFPHDARLLDVTWSLTTWMDDAQIGLASEFHSSIYLSEVYSSPQITNWMYEDSRPETVALTEDNQVLIKSQSELTVYITFATPQNGANLVSYTVNLGDKSVTAEAEVGSNVGTIHFGVPNDSGQQILTLTVTDSRGFSSDVTQEITVLPYKPISIDSWEARRRDNVEATTTLTFKGTVSPVIMGTVSKNIFIGADYALKESTSTEYGEVVPIADVEIGVMGYEYPIAELFTLDPARSYDIRLTVRDKLTESTVVIPVPRGVPLIAMRQERVGIDINEPTRSLDVGGNIGMNGYNVMGVVRSLQTDEKSDTLTEEGIFFKPVGETSDGYPTHLPGVIECIPAPYDGAIHRFTVISTGEIYNRMRVAGAWSDWIPANGGGEPNVINTIQIESGAPLIVQNKTVTIPLAQAKTPGVVLSTEKENGVEVGESGKMYVHSLNVSKLVQNEGEVLVLRGKIYDKE